MIQDHSRFSAAKAYGSNVGERVERFLPMVRKLAWHLAGSCGPSLDVEDLMQAGLVALTECAQKHEGPGEDGFAAYAKLRVRHEGEIIEIDARPSDAIAVAVTCDPQLPIYVSEDVLEDVLGEQ